MATTPTYPGVIMQGVQDDSAGSRITSTINPLHFPLFFIQAEKGEVGVPVACDQAGAYQVFGDLTFDPTKPFFTHQLMFAKFAMSNQKVFLLRLADSTSATASLVLQLTLTPQALVQYQKDALGNRLINSTTGAYEPQLQADGVTPVTANGYVASWSVRPLAAGETFDGLKPVTVGTGDTAATTYPIIAFQGTSPGTALNRLGFKFYSTTDVNTTTETAVSSILYRFTPVLLASDSSGNTSTIVDIYDAQYNDVSLKASAIDPSTTQDVSLNAILQQNFNATDSGKTSNVLDMNVQVYSDNVTAIGNQIMTLATEIPAGTDPFMINLVTAEDINGIPYDHFAVDTDSSMILSSDVVQYLQGGSDGTVSLANLESLIQSYLLGDDNVDFQNYYKYPISHVYDSGFSLATKYALMNVYSLRDDINLTWATQDLLTSPSTANTAAQDQSAGAAILSRVRTYPESTDFGTGAMRGEIYQQCGWLATTTGYTAGMCVTTLVRLLQRCKFYSGQYISGSPKGRPNNEVTIFRKLSWTAATPTQKQLNWDTCLNAVTDADMDTLFIPDIRSPYTDSTSLLSDGVFVDYLTFIKHIVRNKWTYYVGKNDSIAKLKNTIENDMDQTIAAVFKGKISSTTTVTQTEADLLAGDTATVTVAVQGSMPNRIWNVIIPVSRATATSTTSTTVSTASTTAS